MDLTTEVTGTLPVANGGTGSTTLSGILKGNGTGLVQTAIGDTDYQVPLTFGDGLTRTLNDIDCDTASASVFGCLSTTDWTTFNSKLGSGDQFWAIATNYNANTVSTTTPIWSRGSFYASSTSFFSGLLTFANATGTQLTLTDLFIGGDQINEFAGTGLTVASNALTTTLGTSVTLSTAGSEVTGTLPVANGGTGATTLTGLLYGSGTSALTAVTGTAGQFPYYNGSDTLLATSTIFISTASRVGIGTTTPNSVLNIAGIDPKLTISDTDGSVNQKHWFMQSILGSFAIGTTSDALIDASIASLIINSSGNVGIGINAPATKLDILGTASSTGLQVNGSGTVTGDLTVGTTLTGSAGQEATLFVVTGSDDYLTHTNTSNFGTSTELTASIWFKRDGTGLERIMAFLQAFNNFMFYFGSDNRLYMTNRNDAGTVVLSFFTDIAFTDNNWHHALISFDLTDSAKRSIYIDDSPDATNWVTYTTTGGMDFVTTRYTVGGVNVTSEYDGLFSEVYLNTGSSTTNNAYLDLNVESNRRLFIDSAGKPVNLGTGGSTPLGWDTEIYMSDGRTNTGSTTAFTNVGASAGVGPNTNTTAKFKVTSSKVSIGSSTPSALLSIQQTINATTSGIWIAASDGDWRTIYMNATNTLNFGGGSGNNNPTLSRTGSWTSASDLAYKDNIEDLNYGLEAVKLLQPRRYHFKGVEDASSTDIGFVAQELELVIPEVVFGEDGSKSVAYGNLVAVAIQAIKDLATALEQLGVVFVDGIARFSNIFADSVTTERLCREGVCLDEAQLIKLLEENNIAPASKKEELSNLEVTPQD